MGKDILFIQENGLAELLGIEALSAYIKKDGHTADLILLSHTKDYIEYIRETDPGVIGFSVLTGNHGLYYKLSTAIKKVFPEKLVIMGGPHVTYYPESLVRADVDVYCIGDGEKPLSMLLDRIKKGQDHRDIPGLWVKDAGGVIRNDPTLTLGDLDSLPIPDRDIYYDKYPFMKDLTTKRFVASRGCPFPCTYCFNHVRINMYGEFIPVVRMKSADTIISEILDVKKKYVMKGVHFSDESFGLKKDFLEEFCRKYKEQVDLPFSFLMRFDQMDEEKIRMLKRAGCTGIEIGLESGSERVRKELLRKDFSNDKIRASARLLKKYKIKIYTSNIIGNPTESFDEMMETFRLNRSIGTDYTDCNIFIPFPKLDLTKKAEEVGYLEEGYDEDSIILGHQHPRTKALRSKSIINLKTLFFFLLKLRVPEQFIRFLVNRRCNGVYKLLSMFEMYKSMRFFRIGLVSGMKFFLNTQFSAKGVIFGLKDD